MVVLYGGQKSLPAHPFNALIFQSSGIVCNQFAFVLSLDIPLSILVISYIGFEGGTLVLIASFPGHCLSLTFYIRVFVVVVCGGPKKSTRTFIKCSYFSNPQGLLAISLHFSCPLIPHLQGDDKSIKA